MSIIRFALVLFVTVILLPIGFSGQQSTGKVGSAQPASSDPVRQWIAKAALPLGNVSAEDAHDFRAIVEVSSHARVIGFGETAHQTHELQLLRLQTLKALAETRQIRVLAMEAGYVETLELNRWITGKSSRSPDFEAAFPFNGEGKLTELRNALEWLHSFNQTMPPAERIQFYGLDLPYGGGTLAPALNCVWDYLDRLDPELARRSRQSMQVALNHLGEGWPAGAKKRFDALDTGEQVALLNGIGELEEAFDAKRSQYSLHQEPLQFERIRQAVAVAHETLSFMRHDPQDSSNPRDHALADNLRWVLQKIAQDGKVILWAHNAHVQKQSIEVAGLTRTPAASMGEILAGRLGDQYMSIGTTVGRLANEETGRDTSAKAGSVDEFFAGVGLPCYLIDLRAAPGTGPVADWLKASHDIRFQDTYLRVIPKKAFDALLFVEQASPSVRIKEGKN